MIVIIDYGMGNLESVKNAVLFLGKKAVVTASPEGLKSAKKIIFPGVGHFAQAVKQLESRRLVDPLKEKIKEGIPFLGICLGMHLLFEKSSEAQGVSGLGVIKGKVSRFDDNGLIVPHMGWNQIKKVQSPKSKVQSQDEMVDLFEGIEDGSYFYFAHSYFCQPCERAVLATTDYGQEFVSALGKKNIWGIQFHPEKSQKNGLKVLENFLKI
jgi:imidazole glycerol phosphate synthase glutamine amidotransferase subunit